MPREWVGENNTCLVSIEMELNNEMDVAKKHVSVHVELKFY